MPSVVSILLGWFSLKLQQFLKSRKVTRCLKNEGKRQQWFTESFFGALFLMFANILKVRLVLPNISLPEK